MTFRTQRHQNYAGVLLIWILPYIAQVHSMFGAPEAKIPPLLPKFTPLPKRFFSQDNPKESICPVSLCIIRMKQKYLLNYLVKGCRGINERQQIRLYRVKTYVLLAVQNTDKSATHLGHDFTNT